LTFRRVRVGLVVRFKGYRARVRENFGWRCGGYESVQRNRSFPFVLIDELGRIMRLNVSELPDSPLESSSCSDGKVFGEFRVGVRWM